MLGWVDHHDRQIRRVININAPRVYNHDLKAPNNHNHVRATRNNHDHSCLHDLHHRGHHHDRGGSATYVIDHHDSGVDHDDWRHDHHKCAGGWWRLVNHDNFLCGPGVHVYDAGVGE